MTGIVAAIALSASAAAQSEGSLGELTVLVVGLPLMALAAGWLLAGREPAAMARQPLD